MLCLAYSVKMSPLLLLPPCMLGIPISQIHGRKEKFSPAAVHRVKEKPPLCSAHNATFFIWEGSPRQTKLQKRGGAVG